MREIFPFGSVEVNPYSVETVHLTKNLDLDENLILNRIIGQITLTFSDGSVRKGLGLLDNWASVKDENDLFLGSDYRVWSAKTGNRLF